MLHFKSAGVAPGPAGMGGALCIDPEAASNKRQASSLTNRIIGL